jgi:hypothetical protein
MIEGKEGMGKSTFLQYYFSYFLPHYHRFESYDEMVEGPTQEWSEKVSRHIVLCADLYGVHTSSDMYTAIATSFSQQLAKWPNLPRDVLDPADSANVPVDSLQTILSRKMDKLARLTQNSSAVEERKYFITWVFENTDLMPDDLQVDLVSSLVRCVPQEIPKRCPYTLVDEMERILWKIIIPARPETHLRIISELEELRNKEVWKLAPIPWRGLDHTRGRLLAHLVNDSGRHVYEIVRALEKRKSPLKITIPEMAALSLRDAFTAGISEGNGGGGTAAVAKSIQDQLVNDSARRYLQIRRRVAMSRVINERLDQGRRQGWRRPMIVPFYYFDGLMCGEEGVYRPSEDDNLILNLYDMGVSLGDSLAFSLLVGVHTMGLLCSGNSWNDVATKLLQIGYPKPDVTKALLWLETKGVVKRTGKSESGEQEYEVEQSVVNAHWSLLRERAYTDNVAIALARKLNLIKAGDNPETDSTNYAHFAFRVQLSCAFLNFVKQAQDQVRCSRTAKARHGKDPDQFKDFLEGLALPDVYMYAGSEYRDRALRAIQGRLRSHLRLQDEENTVRQTLMTLPEAYRRNLHLLRASS